jgi:hypothetical protein
MGGPSDPYNYRYRWLDGVRAWCDAHDLVMLMSIAMTSALLSLAFVGAVFASSVYVRLETLDQRIYRIESVMFRQTSREEWKNGTYTAAGD